MTVIVNMFPRIVSYPSLRSERERIGERTWERGCQIHCARNLLKYMSILSCKIIISICLSLRNLYVHIAGWSFYSEAFWPMDVLNLDILKGDKSYTGVSPMANCARIFPLTGPSLNPWAVNTKEWNFSLNYVLTLLIQLSNDFISSITSRWSGNEPALFPRLGEELESDGNRA